MSKFSKGGLVPGRKAPEGVMLLLEPGTTYIRREVAEKYGESFMKALNGIPPSMFGGERFAEIIRNGDTEIVYVEDIWNEVVEGENGLCRKEE